MSKSYRLEFSLCFILCLSNASNASVIDFETVPGGTPSDQLAISTQYRAIYGVTFSLERGGTDTTPYLEQTGTSDAGHGFWNAAANTFDTEATGYEGELGNYFLRFGTSTFSDTPGPILIITYDTPVSAASAQIWDIDAAPPTSPNGYEAWTITARDIGGVVIDTINSPVGINENLSESLNAKPWTWSFDHEQNDIYSIAVEFSGTASIVGLAFDNFSPATAVVPLPAAGLLFGTGLISIIAVARRKIHI